MEFSDLRRQFHQAASLDEIVAFFSCHAAVLATHVGCEDCPTRFSLTEFEDFGHEWCCDIWSNAGATFGEHLFPHLGLKIVWSHTGRHGTDTYVAMAKSDWPWLQVLERLGGLNDGSR